MTFRQYADALTAAFGYVSFAEYPQILTVFSCSYLGVGHRLRSWPHDHGNDPNLWRVGGVVTHLVYRFHPVLLGAGTETSRINIARTSYQNEGDFL